MWSRCSALQGADADWPVPPRCHFGGLGDRGRGGFQHHGAAPGADRGDLRQGRSAGDLRVHAVKEMANFYFYL